MNASVLHFANIYVKDLLSVLYALGLFSYTGQKALFCHFRSSFSLVHSHCAFVHSYDRPFHSSFALVHSYGADGVKRLFGIAKNIFLIERQVTMSADIRINTGKIPSVGNKADKQLGIGCKY